MSAADLRPPPWGHGRKDALAWLFAVSGISAVRTRLRAGAQRTLPILAYHRIADIGAEDAFPWDPELVSASVDDFAWQMDTLARHFHPIALSEALRLGAEGRALPRGAVAVTFDDGHGDNYTHAFPIMARNRVPATIFVSTGYMDGAETFWFDDVAMRLHQSPHATLSLPSLGLELALGGVAERRAAAARVLRAMKEVPEATRLAAIAELRARAGVERVPQRGFSRPLTWAQAREMRAGRIEFGSHTVSHPILSRIGDAQLAAELRDSRAAIESHLDAPADTLAYPVGGEEAYDERVVRIARECGYRVGLTYVSGVSAWPPEHPFRVRRLHVERYTTRARFLGMLAFPALLH